MHLEEFDYDLPEELIAQVPIEPRDSSRLLVLNRQTGEIEHSCFNQLGTYLRAGDVLVINNTKVLPARLYAHKDTGAVIELVLLRQRELDIWQALVRPAKRAKPGTILRFPGDKLTGEVVDFDEDGTMQIKFSYEGNFFAILDEIGQMPLPPYIKVKLEDQNRYQPVYADTRGSAAAPTAGLHFTPELLESLTAQGIIIAKVLLHVGLGTFRPVKVDNIEEHQMHEEYYCIDEENAQLINDCRARGGRVICVGTTSTRTLETVSDENGLVCAQHGFTRKYIYPGYHFKAVDGIVTNFHLPKSTLIMMISAFAGKEHVFNAYQCAIDNKYRFFSFGDAMLIL